MSLFQSQRTALLVVLTGALLLVLAVLQYLWVGELTRFELELTERNLAVSTRGFALELGDVFQNIGFTYRVRRGPDLGQELFDEYRSWLDSTMYPGLIVDAYWIDAAPRSSPDIAEAFRLRRAGLDEAALVPVEWPPSFDPIKRRLDDTGDFSFRTRSRAPREWTIPFEDDRWAYVVPQGTLGPPGWAAVILDQRVLLEGVIPTLVDQYFGVEDQRDYRLRLLESGEPSAQVLYATDTAFAADAGTTPDIRRDIIYEGADWVVEVTHESGSLETYVGWHRWRNLSLGFGAVIVLGVSFGFLVTANRRAQALADRQMAFVAGVSHELRTPIAGISSLSQNLADGVVRDLGQAARYGESINTESRRLNAMVEKVLHFSALRSGQYHYERELLDIRAVVESETEALRQSSRDDLRIHATFQDGLPLVAGDAQALRSVVRNLVSNAIKFGPGHGPVTVAVRSVGREIEISVADRGEGISTVDRAHIFEPFYRGQAARAGQAEGSGLGLSLVREFVKAHDGRIEVATGDGDGTRFRVYLPAEAAGNSSEQHA